MILGVDIGGTKTLIGAFTEDGALADSIRFETPQKYDDFLKAFESSFGHYKNAVFSTGAVAVPGLLNRDKGIVVELGNLPWKNELIADDLSKIAGCKLLIENDAKLAALAEAHALTPLPEKVLYVTISTGIGTGVVVNGKLDKTLEDAEGGRILLTNPEGKLVIWESFASGKAIFKKYGKRAGEITDQKAWRQIATNIATGLVDLSAVIEPDFIVLGGGVGSHFGKFSKQLINDVKKLLPSLVKMPKIVGAQHAEQAALLGCYELVKQRSLIHA